MGCLLHNSLKFYDNTFIFVSLKTLGTFNNFLIGCFIKLSDQTFQPLIVIYRVFSCINIGDVHHLVGHSLITESIFHNISCSTLKIFRGSVKSPILIN